MLGLQLKKKIKKPAQGGKVLDRLHEEGVQVLNFSQEATVESMNLSARNKNRRTAKTVEQSKTRVKQRRVKSVTDLHRSVGRIPLEVL